jgi:outer membrane receptor protein involved in Fe transport
MDDYSSAKRAFVPRVAYTKIFNHFHFKALYSFAFRAPTIQNVNFASQELKPEKVQVGELEIGYKKHHFSANINFFDISSKDPIIYINDPENDYYDFINQGKSGTRGVEAEIKHSGKWGFLVWNYSYYVAKNYSDNQDFKVEGNDKLFLGMPQHKSSLRASFHVQNNIWINPSLNYASERYYYLPFNADYDDLRQLKANPFWNANLNFEYNDILKTGVDISLGAYNVFNANTSYVSPTNSGIIYIPYQSREYVITMRYKVR